MFSETRNPVSVSDISEIGRLKKIMDSPQAPFDSRQADRVVLNRMESAEKTQPGDVGNSFKPMEFIYAQNWGRLRLEGDLSDNLKPCNPNYKLGNEWRVNCQRCVPTYEMRKRGYDVTANPKPKEVAASDLCFRPFDVWHRPDVIRCAGNGQNDIERNMRQWGDGARAQVVVVWKNTNSGHTFVAEQVNGKTIYVDPQTGSTDVAKYFQRVENGSVQMCRIDHLDVTNRILECSRKA